MKRERPQSFNTVPMKERMIIPRQDMPEQDAGLRSTNFLEVNLGLTPEQAIVEAQRCIECKSPTCMDGCPVNIKIPDFIQLICKEDFVGAAQKIKEDNSLPAICGRVCPQETQCEEICVMGKRFEPVAIGRLERFVADYAMQHGNGSTETFDKPASSGQKVAIVGSGPAGLAVASDLIKEGHEVTVFEALHEFGGVLVYGIPEFRLPKSILREEVATLEDMGVKFVKNFIVGRTMTIQELMADEGYDAVFLGLGAGLPRFMNIPGENLNGVYSANEFLTRSNLMRGYEFPEWDTPLYRAKHAIIVGGGNTAMDAVRTAKRLGADEASIVYRRSEEEMPARNEEIHHAKEEGIKFMNLVNPIEFISDDQGSVVAAKCLRMELGEPDESGRRRPVPMEGSEFVMDVDMVVIAVGNGSNPLISQTTPEIETNKWGNIVADEDGRTSMEGVFAGGDIVSGGATVILAMGAGRKSAVAINEYLKAKVGS
ncbi:MAG: NADPH-dependent glutamate synthase [Candidatus Marinimicrobia bacterium]|jgi:glutamate synthase (NADPH/NADH) small chain|nr:NADPH-dependent glutamate synthase [Candidatus Neomarinimicrobiota bacterium]MBT3576191.1 NADPH-dependent glutamate synthase [Candidatus Neomarinimicrobiota bacterium]MBT3680610.1 NADPH-dependent glutamate synthase [Candidatus Neomarinimicrobiota bacterium]MBT3950901.1 NADPH-dependent glutamate synthase [Candidatus Neomarinimicrobiota bacterium]MBT4251898.1 NADPH-dependent glutamate synthase [Candidatus Neomarinimicrobiota bacterium]